MSLEMKNKHLGFRHGFAVGLGVLVLLLGGALGFVDKNKSTSNAASSNNAPAVILVDQLSDAFERVAKQVEPGVVNISTEQVIHSNGIQDPFGDMFGENNPFRFFGQPRDMKQKSLGSGFVVDPRGYILTNDHVIKNATKIKVKLQDGREFDGTVVGTDPQTDLAVIKVKASDLPTLRLAISDQVRVGQWVLAFGSPFGLEQTMTAGIISAKGREVGGNYDNFLQTDAAINPGNSGGPLVNLAGEVVGINNMILSDSGGFQGVGLAIPASTANRVYSQLINNGKVTRGWLGVTIQELTPGLAKSFDLPNKNGVLVAQVEPGSPAAKADIRAGDIILNFNGEETKTLRDLTTAVADSKVGAPAKIKLMRDGKPMALDVSVGEKPSERAENVTPGDKAEHAKLGLEVKNVDSETARQLKLSSPGGALVTDVQSGSPADEGGVQPGDVIRGINHKTVNTVSDLQSATKDLKNGSTVLLNVIRNGQALFLAFELS
jgi:serine protease Do